VSQSKTSEDVHGYTVYIYSMYSVIEGEDVLAGQRGTVCHQLCDCETAVCPWERSKGGWRRISSVMDNNEHHPALLGRF